MVATAQQKENIKRDLAACLSQEKEVHVMGDASGG